MIRSFSHPRRRAYPKADPTHMKSIVQPYLMFDGRCAEALEFYKTALGAEVEMAMRFKDSPEPCPDAKPEQAEKIMHASFKIGQSVVMASDGNCAGKAQFSGFSLSISAETPEEVDRIFNALAEGGQVQMPPAQTFWSPRFGMVQDRFGVSWMVGVFHQK